MTCPTNAPQNKSTSPHPSADNKKATQNALFFPATENGIMGNSIGSKSSASSAQTKAPTPANGCRMAICKNAPGKTRNHIASTHNARSCMEGAVRRIVSVFVKWLRYCRHIPPLTVSSCSSSCDFTSLHRITRYKSSSQDPHTTFPKPKFYRRHDAPAPTLV